MTDFSEHELRFRTLVHQEDKEAAYRLRHQVFAEELGWVPCKEDGREVDDYDRDCILVGLSDRSRLLGCLRILLPHQQFMIEKEFKGLLGDHRIEKGKETIEVTRFCLAGDLRKSQVITRYGRFPLVMALEKAFYSWCRANGMDEVYMVVSKFFFRLLNLLGMPCTALAPPVTMPDGVVALAAISSWSAFELFNEEKNPALLAWFRDSSGVEVSRRAA